jgi:hypothetical protein
MQTRLGSSRGNGGKTPANGVGAPSDGAKKRQRSAVTNGARPFIKGDGGSPWARRMRDLTSLHIDDLGGAEAMSEAQLSLCRRAATIELELEMMEGKLSLGEAVDLDLYNRLSGNLRRILESIGIERKAKTVDLSAQERIDAFWERKRLKAEAEAAKAKEIDHAG